MEDYPFLSDDDFTILLGCGALFCNKTGSTPLHNSILTGEKYYEELMTTENQERVQTCLRMSRHTFIKLLDLLQSKGGLRNGREVSAGEKLAV